MDVSGFIGLLLFGKKNIGADAFHRPENRADVGISPQSVEKLLFCHCFI